MLPALSQSHYVLRPKFGSEKPPVTPPAPEPATETPTSEKPPKGKKFKAAKFKTTMGKLRRKFTNWNEFRGSCQQGYFTARDDFWMAMHSGSKGKMAGRVAMESLGLVVLVAFIWFPGPNPGWLVSPTGRKFFKGFMADSPAAPVIPEPVKPDKK